MFPPPALPSGTILILDEAHNLPATITNLATLTLDLGSATCALEVSERSEASEPCDRRLRT